MDTPNVKTELKIPELNFTFCVIAYRKATREEMHFAYNYWRSQKKSNKPKRNQRVDVITIIGYND